MDSLVSTVPLLTTQEDADEAAAKASSESKENAEKAE